MRLWTSHFWLAGNSRKAVSISRSVPIFFHGPRYLKLAPSWELIRAFKDGLDPEVYEAIYREDVLSKLTPGILAADLEDDSVLLCWERTGFCHRHIVCAWLNELGIECEEIE